MERSTAERYAMRHEERAERLLEFLNARGEGFWWFLGAMLGDGNVFSSEKYHRVSIGCCEELKEKLLRYVGLFAVSQKGDSFFQCYINSKCLVDWFEANLGIKGPKSETIRVPDLIKGEAEFYEFLRGYLDTDGTVIIFEPKKRKTRSFSCSFASKSIGMFEDIKKISEKDGMTSNIHKNIKKMKGKEFVCYTLRFHGQSALDLLARVYKNKGELYLSYKFERYMEFVRWKEGTSICVICGSKAWSDSLCHACFWKRKEEKCSCGASMLAHGVCASQYNFYDRNKALNVLRYCKDNPMSPKDSFATRNPSQIDKMLHRNLVSFYVAKHSECLSIAECLDGKDISNLTHEVTEARRFKKVKPASWFFTQDAFELLKMMKERFCIESVFDPFAGWGARAAGALLNGLSYVANELNQYLLHELQGVFKTYDSIHFREKNSFACEVEECDCMFSCPPYWLAEDYGYRSNERKTVGSYERFLSRLVSLVVKFMKLNTKCICLCIDDFHFEGKRYSFVQDMINVLGSHGVESEDYVYKTKYNSFKKSNQSYHALIIDCKQTLDISVSNNRVYSYTKCSECEEKVESDGLCRKHYAYYYRRMMGAKNGKTMGDKIGLFLNRPDLTKKLEAAFNEESSAILSSG